MRQYPKSVRRELNALATTAYERELDSALEDLYLSFEKWKTKQIDCFELNQLIHEFHQSVKRIIFKAESPRIEDSGYPHYKLSYYFYTGPHLERLYSTRIKQVKIIIRLRFMSMNDHATSDIVKNQI